MVSPLAAYMEHTMLQVKKHLPNGHLPSDKVLFQILFAYGDIFSNCVVPSRIDAIDRIFVGVRIRVRP